MTKFSKKLFLTDLDPALPPENGETNLYQTTAGYLVSHGPAGVLLEAADGFSLETTPDGVQEVTMTARCELIISDTAVIVGDEERRAGDLTIRTLYFDGGGRLTIMTDDAMTVCEMQSHRLHVVIDPEGKSATITGSRTD